ncbi:FIST C-terminal domain-containing protein [Nocardiopsis sp. RSe5-2]|uniref:FIST C-terminal domain-containing protein n=1 Tax=Nocardiopsis endophytica TaxID=3018445 RepID=A0ABT4U1Y4_9ACTN|nr:FIST N-terminal domain-containing protein [Nocardiopsis endophytica]MDA2810954.1 FIST C-terminal domain-containing protein [Nocardiopsis endophytica]
MARFGDALASGADLVSAAERAVQEAVRSLDGPPDLIFFSVCGTDTEEVVLAGERVMGMAPGSVSIGCTSAGVIGGGRGVEEQGAVSVWAARLPDVEMTPFQLDVVPEGDHLAVIGMREPDESDRAALLLADPYRFPAQSFVERSTDALGGLPLVGGLADGMGGNGSVRLFFEGEVVDAGAIGLLLGGDGIVGTMVSQGCRPVGPAMAVTGAEGNVVSGLAGVPAYDRLEQLINALPPEEQELAAGGGLHIGIAMDEYADRHEQGDFLIRSVVGADPDENSLTIGDTVDVGQTVRFQVRDRDTADTDLLERLGMFGEDTGGRAAGVLLFSCNGRGASMFGTADHDVRAVRRALGVDAVTGFFAAGEVGPVAGRNHVHSYTACLLAFGD